MHIKIYYGGSLITECNGEDVENMIENSFRHLDSIIHEHSGNAAGFTLTKVYIEHDSSANDIAWLHVFAHGNDGLINYDPITDTDKEILFKKSIEDFLIALCEKSHGRNKNETIYRIVRPGDYQLSMYYIR